VLDITVEGRSFNFDAASVVGIYATSIENRLLMAQSREHVVLRFQASPGLLTTPMEALAGITAQGQVAWLNAAASRLLGVPAFSVGRDVPSLLGVEFDAVLAMTRQTSLTPIRLPNGLGVWAQASSRGLDGIDFGHAVAFAGSVETTASSVVSESFPESDILKVSSSAGELLPSSGCDDEGKLPSLASLSEHHQHLIDRTLGECEGNISRAARTLGVSRGLLYRHLRNRQTVERVNAEFDGVTGAD